MAPECGWPSCWGPVRVAMLLLLSFGLLEWGVGAVVISNTQPRFDTSGQWMDVHDGNVVQVNGLYYWAGMRYGACPLLCQPYPLDTCQTCCPKLIPFRICPGCCRGSVLETPVCGFFSNHTIALYSSPNLVNWTLVSLDILPASVRPSGIYYRPKVAFNSATNKWVLWVNMVPRRIFPAFAHAVYVVATSDTLSGPFTVVTPCARTRYSAPGDFAFFVDDSITPPQAYIAYDSFEGGLLGINHRISVEQLNPSWTDSLGGVDHRYSSGLLPPTGQEAPMMFRRGEYIYLLFGYGCCFCSIGSNARLYTATSPLGPYTDAKVDLNAQLENHVNVTIHAQNNAIYKFGDTFVYTADRWTSAPDGLKGHDFQYWYPLEWNTAVTPALPLPVRWVDSFSLNVAPIPTAAPTAPVSPASASSPESSRFVRLGRALLAALGLN